MASNPSGPQKSRCQRHCHLPQALLGENEDFRKQGSIVEVVSQGRDLGVDTGTCPSLAFCHREAVSATTGSCLDWQCHLRPKAAGPPDTLTENKNKKTLAPLKLVFFPPPPPFQGDISTLLVC